MFAACFFSTYLVDSEFIPAEKEKNEMKIEEVRPLSFLFMKLTVREPLLHHGYFWFTFEQVIRERVQD